MISNDLQSLSDWVLGHAAHDTPLDKPAMAHLARVLLDLSHQVERLELLPVNSAGQLPGTLGRSQQERDPDGK